MENPCVKFQTSRLEIADEIFVQWNGLNLIFQFVPAYFGSTGQTEKPTDVPNMT